MKSNKYAWVYYDTYLDQIVLVSRPHRRVINPRYHCLIYEPSMIMLEDGEQTDILEDNIRDAFSISRYLFKKDMVYLGRLK